MDCLTKKEKNQLNQHALQAARDYSQTVAWPTVILAIVVFGLLLGSAASRDI